MKYFIKTFGCQQNVADSERIAAELQGRGMRPVTNYKSADYVVINTCMVRQSAENRVYGLVNNLSKLKTLRQARSERSRTAQGKHPLKIIVTGCMVGVAHRDKTGKYLQRLKNIMPAVDEFMPIEEVGFDHAPLRTSSESGWVPISNGCNNFCTFCIVPFTRGREISRPYEDIISECMHLKAKGYKNVTLLGMNVNSYGADLVVGEKNIQVMRDLPGKDYFHSTSSHSGKPQAHLEDPESFRRRAESDSGQARTTMKVNGKAIKPIFVKHLGRLRIPTLFPYLLEEVARLGFEKVDFMSSNPWDFSDELIDVIARNKNIGRTLHFALQSGDDNVLKRMNRWYTSKEYLNLLQKMRKKIPGVKFTTDIIVGFCGETEKEFKSTVALCKKADFSWAFISIYSQRPMTAATKVFADDVPHEIKKKRWEILDQFINKPHLLKNA